MGGVEPVQRELRARESLAISGRGRIPCAWCDFLHLLPVRCSEEARARKTDNLEEEEGRFLCNVRVDTGEKMRAQVRAVYGKYRMAGRTHVFWIQLRRVVETKTCTGGNPCPALHQEGFCGEPCPTEAPTCDAFSFMLKDTSKWEFNLKVRIS